MIKTFWALLVFSGLAAAQPVGAGLKVGSLLTDVLSVRGVPTFAQYNAEAHRYIVGGYVELRLPAQMAVEVDALYRNYAFTIAGGSPTVNSWEFPMLLKHKMLPGPVKPY